jgi:hypothetical protein
MVPPRRAAPLPGFIPLLDKTLERVGSCGAMDISPEMSRFRIEGARHGRSRQAGSAAKKNGARQAVAEEPSPSASESHDVDG